jgi:hypothetical protein
MKSATEVPVFEVTQFPAIVWGYQMAQDEEPFIFAKHVPEMKSESATAEKVWTFVVGHASNYSTDSFALQSPNIGRPFFGDAQRLPWYMVDQERDSPFVFCGLLTDSSNFVWGAPIPRGDGWGFCERVAELLFGNDVAQKVGDILKELHEGGR